jgi:hypothetical protein
LTSFLILKEPAKLRRLSVVFVIFRRLFGALPPVEQDQIQQDLQQRVERSGKAFFPSTVLHGRRVLRVNINSYLTERRHVDDLIELLVSEGAALVR